jgi:endonuclease-3
MSSWSPELCYQAIQRLSVTYRHAKTDLLYENSFQLLVAVLLSAQSTDKQVNTATAKLFKIVKSPSDLVSLDSEHLEELIKSVGLYRNKAKNLLSLGKHLLERFNGDVPQSFAELESLPGVGHKTASVVLAVAFNIPALAVDTHVFRVANRVGLADAKKVELVEEQLKQIISKEQWASAHHWLLQHGRLICVARTPKCSECLIADLCRTRLE